MDEVRAEMAAAAKAGGFLRTSIPPTTDVLLLLLRAFIIACTRLVLDSSGIL